jgi:mannose-1-phosphate guanylyltransferase/mannose-6-phosphate isomerase
MSLVIPVILSGGSGTRLWPISTEELPKTFIEINKGENLLLKTLKRALSIEFVNEILTVTNEKYFFQTKDLYESSKLIKSENSQWILEPEAKNTGPAIIFAALELQQKYGSDSVMIILPADHLIDDSFSFANDIALAVKLAEQGYITTFGKEPTRVETGFGYIEQGTCLDYGTKVIRFIEKPNESEATALIAAGNYLWNTGIFCMKVSSVLAEFEKYCPNLVEFANSNFSISSKAAMVRTFDKLEFSKLPSISFDNAVMEKTDLAAVLNANFDWNDVGSWNAMHDVSLKDHFGNYINVKSNFLMDTNNCYIKTENKFIATIGINNLIIIDTPDALLVVHKNNVQDVKKVSLELKNNNYTLSSLHKLVYRPWGSYTVLEEGERFKIKRLVVNPGQSISKQLHYHRNEHWVVVSGTAKVINGEIVKLLQTNQSIYIESGQIHRLENPGITDLVVIEVQSGEYLGEDDIVRFEDNYGRS